MNVAIIKYNAGNIHSVKLALNRIGIKPVVSDEPEIVSQADKIIFPGVGEASSAMTYLKNKKLDSLLNTTKIPVLGICLGLQLLCRHSQENNTPCLNVFHAEVRKFPDGNKIPHMGWNSVYNLNGELFKNIPENSYVYFVHSYYAEAVTEVSAYTTYSLDFAAALQKDNYFAVQFHPEKSGETGERILQNFLKL